MSNIIIPSMVFLIVLYAYLKKEDVYNLFIDGCKESFQMVLTILPNLFAMILAINLLLDSNILNIFSIILKPLLSLINVPFEIIPMTLMRPISGTSTLALLNNLYSKYGPDSYISTLGSIIQGSTDTTFYVISLYFGSIGIKKIRYSLFAGLFADLVGIISSIIIVKFLF